MRKFLSMLLLLIGILFLFTAETSASEAAVRGFELDGFKYLNHETSDIKVLTGSKHKYGEMNMWTSVYRYYIEAEDKMIYAVLVEAMVNSSTEKNASRSFSTKQMRINVDFDSNHARLVTYTPRVEGGSYTLSTSIGTQHVYIPELGIITLPTITQTITEEFKEISLFPTNRDNGVTLDFNFTRYADNRRGTPYQGSYSQQAAVYFSIDRYSHNVSNLEKAKITINYTPSIFKDAAWFEKNATYNYTTDTHQYKYTSNGNFK